MSVDCLICFCPIEVGFEHQCSDIRCTGKICRECLTLLIEFSAKESVMPKCPNTDCRSYFILADLVGISFYSYQKYRDACLDFFLKDHGDNIQKQLQEIAIIKKLRKERQKFITTNYPKAVALVASITLTSKLKRLEKQKSKILHNQMQQSYRSCMNLTCTGFLDKNLVCMTCQSEFCSKCEILLKQGHKCKQIDLDSVNLVNNMTKCSGCKLPVFKDEGCDSITCSNCGTKFLYSTGKEGGHGSSNAKITVNIQQRQKLSHSYTNKIPKDLFEKILVVEGLEPKTISKKTLLSPLKLFFQTGNRDSTKKLLAKRINAYYINQLLMRDYQKHMVDLETLLKDEDPSHGDLLQCIEDCISRMTV